MNKHKYTILVVDDEPMNHLVLQDLLINEYFLLFALNGNKALEMINQNKPDLILLDILMPEMDGYELCKILKLKEATKDIPVIFISCLGGINERIKAFDLGGCDYINKPFEHREVLARIKVQLSVKSAQNQLLENFEKLQRVEKQRDNLAHMIVHDIGTLLNVLNMSLNLLKYDIENDNKEAYSSTINNAIKASQMLEYMTKDIIDINKLESEKMPIHKENKNLSEIIHLSVQAVNAMNIHSNFDIYTPKDIYSFCDTNLIQRVIINLISNAIKHSPSNKPIQISLTNEAGVAKVEVKDKGFGVPEEYKDKIFDKYECAKAKKNHKYHSSGLGLTFCKLAIEAHDGKVGVESVPGKGSNFYFTLPLNH